MLFDDGGLESATLMQGRRGHAGVAGCSGVKRNVFSAGWGCVQLTLQGAEKVRRVAVYRRANAGVLCKAWRRAALS